jgi:hypothetical protein
MNIHLAIYNILQEDNSIILGHVSFAISSSALPTFDLVQVVHLLLLVLAGSALQVDLLLCRLKLFLLDKQLDVHLSPLSPNFECQILQ